MSDIPSGSVVFLFTDIEGSTKLAQEIPDAYPIIHKQHDDILKEVIKDNEGHIFKIIGDSFCVSFANVKKAVTASVEIQKRLMTEQSGEFRIKVRMGIHLGEAEFLNNDYVGYVTLSRSQRIMSTAHGGQILLTQEVFDSLKDETELNVSFKDFGKRKLKDIILPEHIYQLVSDGLPSEFPPLKSLDARQNNIPTSITHFIGRDKEINEILKLLPKSRMITLIGAGGTGKTRLALRIGSELIDEFDNGVWITELSPITNPDSVVKEISNILNLKEEADQDIFDTLKEFLKSKKILLILDNCEHLLDIVAQTTDSLLKSCMNLKIIATSRGSLNIHGETVYRVPPMSMPENVKQESFETLSGYESVKLFLDRAVSINANFKLTSDNIYNVAELCKKLDGIPLAIELAAKRVNVLPVDKILARLDDRFKLLTSGSSTALPRQKTLRAMIDWSYDMLNQNEQLLLQRLSVFMGGWTLEAAEVICSDEEIDEFEVLDMMNSLLDKSLILYSEDKGRGRYGILESIKYYALEKLANKTEIYHKHLEYFLELSSFSEQKGKGLDQLGWLKMMETERDNIRSNIAYAEKEKSEIAVKLVINTFDFWFYRGYFREGLETSLNILENVKTDDPKQRADLLYRIAFFCYSLGKFSELGKYSNEALELYRSIDDKEGILNSLNIIGLKYYTELDNAEAARINEEALKISNEINSAEGKAKSLYNLSFPIGNLGDVDKSILLKEEALKIARYLRNEHLTAQVLLSLSISISLRKGDIKKAALLSEQSLALSRSLDDLYLISVNLVHLASLKLYFEDKNYDEAEYILLEAFKISKDYGYKMNLFPIRVHMGVLYTETGKLIQAITVFTEYMKERKNPGGNFFINHVIAGFGRIFLKRNEYSKAARLFGFIENLSESIKNKLLNRGLLLREDEKITLQKGLGEEEFNKLMEEGKSFNLDEAVNSCLGND